MFRRDLVIVDVVSCRYHHPEEVLVVEVWEDADLGTVLVRLRTVPLDHATGRALQGETECGCPTVPTTAFLTPETRTNHQLQQALLFNLLLTVYQILRSIPWHCLIKTLPECNHFGLWFVVEPDCGPNQAPPWRVVPSHFRATTRAVCGTPLRAKHFSAGLETHVVSVHEERRPYHVTG